MTRFFYGGKPGLKPGDYITPDDGRPSFQITTDREFGRYDADHYGAGDLYVVNPVGGVEADPKTGQWQCHRARVLSVYVRYVRLTRSQRYRIFRKVSPVGEHPAKTRRTFDQMEARGLALAAAKQLRADAEREQAELDAAIEDGWKAVPSD